jgi:hypothetical protein
MAGAAALLLLLLAAAGARSGARGRGSPPPGAAAADAGADAGADGEVCAPESAPLHSSGARPVPKLTPPCLGPLLGMMVVVWVVRWWWWGGDGMRKRSKPCQQDRVCRVDPERQQDIRGTEVVMGICVCQRGLQQAIKPRREEAIPQRSIDLSRQGCQGSGERQPRITKQRTAQTRLLSSRRLSPHPHPPTPTKITTRGGRAWTWRDNGR